MYLGSTLNMIFAGPTPLFGRGEGGMGCLTFLLTPRLLPLLLEGGGSSASNLLKF